MYKEDFYDFDGSLTNCLAEITDYLINNSVSNPVLAIVQQSDYTIHFVLYYD